MDKTQHMLEYMFRYGTKHPMHAGAFMGAIFILDMTLMVELGSNLGLEWVALESGAWSPRVAEYIGVTA